MDKQDIGRITRFGVYWSLGLKFVQQVFHFVVMIVVARILGPKAFGIMAIIMTVINYLNSLTGFGMTSAIVQQSEMEDSTVKTIFTFNLLLSLLFMALIWIFAEQIAGMFKAGEVSDYLKAMSVLVPITSFYSIPMALLRREMRYKEHSIVDLIQYTGFSLVLLCLALLGFGVWSLVAASIAAYLIAGLTLIFFIKWRPELDFRFSRLKNLLEYGGWDMARFHLAYIEENIPNIVISRNLNLLTLGYFERSNSIATIPMRKIQAQINSVIFSALSRLRDDRKRLLGATEKIFIMISFMALPGMVVFAFVSPYFVLVCLGSKWTGMTGPLQLLCILSIFRIYSAALNSINVSIGAYRRHTSIGIVTSLALVGMSFAGVRFGLNGVIGALFIYAVANSIAYFQVTCRALGVRFFTLIGSSAKRLIASVVVIASYILYDYFVCPKYNVAGMLGVILFLTSAYVLVEILMLDEKTKAVFASVKNDFSK